MRRSVVGIVLLFPMFTLVDVATPRAQAAATSQPQAQTAAQSQPPAVAARTSARIWIGKNAAFEEFLRTATVSKIVEVPIGVTKPHRAYFESGGLCESAAWKVLPPGRHNGFWDSYKSEIAAYELDKLLDMNMVPPTVEREIKGDIGAVMLWLSPVHPWKEMEPKPKPASWPRQASAMKMFDNLIGNKDRNQGNLLLDDDWNLFLIDHSRAFISEKDLPWPLEHVNRPLWNKMLALDEATLTPVLQKWVGRGEIRSLLARRDKMKIVIDNLVKKNGERAVFID
jgi:hypothetical protein